MPNKEFTVSLSPHPTATSQGTSWYRITKIVGQGVTFRAPDTRYEYQIGDLIAKDQANTLGPKIRLSVTR